MLSQTHTHTHTHALAQGSQPRARARTQTYRPRTLLPVSAHSNQHQQHQQQQWTNLSPMHQHDLFSHNQRGGSPGTYHVGPPGQRDREREGERERERERSILPSSSSVTRHQSAGDAHNNTNNNNNHKSKIHPYYHSHSAQTWPTNDSGYESWSRQNQQGGGGQAGSGSGSQQRASYPHQHHQQLQSRASTEMGSYPDNTNTGYGDPYYGGRAGAGKAPQPVMMRGSGGFSLASATPPSPPPAHPSPSCPCAECRANNSTPNPDSGVVVPAHGSHHHNTTATMGQGGTTLLNPPSSNHTHRGYARSVGGTYSDPLTGFTGQPHSQPPRPPVSAGFHPAHSNFTSWSSPALGGGGPEEGGTQRERGGGGGGGGHEGMGGLSTANTRSSVNTYYADSPRRATWPVQQGVCACVCVRARFCRSLSCLSFSRWWWWAWGSHGGSAGGPVHGQHAQQRQHVLCGFSASRNVARAARCACGENSLVSLCL